MREVSIVSDRIGLFAVEDGSGPAVVMLHGGLANHRAVLPLVTPLAARYRVIAPDLRGSGQVEAFATMQAFARRAPAEGIDILQPLYARLPDDLRERAWAVAARFDPASVAATSDFLASGAQPFASDAELESLGMPALVV